jgi:nucleotidyltransferase substrate binding protein (TIGR01987 family)
MEQDVRWKQRFNNLKKAYIQLSEAVEMDEYTDLEREGMIQRFEYTYELAWNTIKDFYEYQGDKDIQGSRDAIRLAFERGLIQEGEIWMKMIDNRQRTSHTYNKETAEEIAELIRVYYCDEIGNLITKLEYESSDQKQLGLFDEK